MIGRIEGQLVEMSDNHVLVAVGGVGYELEVTSGVLGQLGGTGAAGSGTPITLYTHFVVREDAQQLYGFSGRAERDLFRVLIRISGVGPKLALALLSHLSLAQLAAAVRVQEVAVLVRIPGVGRKTAERLLVELKDKLPEVAALPDRTTGGAATPPQEALHEALRALESLGYRPAEASRLLDSVQGDAGSAEDLVRAALRAAGRQREALS